MPTAQATIDFLQDQLSSLPLVSTHKMFGEYCLYVAGKPVGLVCDNQLFLKPTDPGTALLHAVVHGHPFPGAKPHLLITADQWEERDWLCSVVQATDQALPMPKPKSQPKAPRSPKAKRFKMAP
ncbi:TfoX/Sxy family protein [Curvibacter sp. CHRR-16]|uniref:TfoX/Sxy family protein n=1 Tax=Curvibacter sp. CHRR-16 TaxID=2835872 RepID=UPI001BDABA3D|nr:TfoX/Sxy family protein [Curvibacter sp. CHRR-16]MBT0570921.1 TfoX/Sxy family protein [Curvibacter sp. CHRR-16]